MNKQGAMGEIHGRNKSITKGGKGQKAEIFTAEDEMENEGNHPPPLLPPGYTPGH